MNNKIYLLGEIPDKRFNAGEKARNDVIDSLKKFNNVEHIIFFKKGENKINVFKNIVFSLRQLKRKIKNDDYIIIQYPYSPILAYKYIYRKIATIRKAKKIVLIHDLNYLRSLKNHSNEFRSFNKELEISTLNKFDKIICHNKNMKNRLIEDGIRSEKIVSLEIFDYLVEDTVTRNKKIEMKKIVTIAGNLSSNKAKYIYDLGKLNIKNIEFELYGPGYSQEKMICTSNINYKGIVKPEELPQMINGDFGLVWDGTSTEKCDGDLGEYLKYNNPHKASLYLACGVPLIVWKESAIAHFVLKNKIGICISNINEIENILNKLDKQEYQEMLSNVENIKHDITNGKYLQRALERCIEK